MTFARYEQSAIYKVQLSGGQRRLKEAILYVAQKCRGFEFFGAIKLNKILWRADFRSYYERGQPVTGRQYQRLEHGPAPVEMPPVLNDLLRDGLIEIEQRAQGEFTEQRPVAKVEPVLRLFSIEDIDYLDESIRHYENMTGRETSDESHGIAWRTRSNGEPIPYQASYFEDRPLSSPALSRLAQLGRSVGWRSE